MTEAREPGKRRPQPEDIPGVIDLVSEGQSLRSACRELGLHTPSTHTMIDDDDRFREQYARAREIRAEGLQEDALRYGKKAAEGKIKPDGARVAIDAIKWAAARMAPKTAPSQKIEHSFDSLTSEERQRRIREKMASMGLGPDASDG